MGKARAFATVLASCALWAPPAVSAAPVRLGGVTVVTGSRPASVDVRLDRPVVVRTPFGPSPDIAVTGAGRYAAVVLKGTDARTQRTTLVGARFASALGARPFLMPAVPTEEVGGWGYTAIKTYPDTVTLPAGSYRLYLLPDGKPVQVTLRLAGLPGAVRVAPSRPAAHQVDYPAPTAPGGTVTNVYSSRASLRLPRTGMLLHALSVGTDKHAAAQYWLCHRYGEPTLPEVLDVAPGCPTGGSVFVNDRRPTTQAEEKFLVKASSFEPAGEHVVGVWYAAESVVTTHRYVAMWLSF